MMSFAHREMKRRGVVLQAMEGSEMFYSGAISTGVEISVGAYRGFSKYIKKK